MVDEYEEEYEEYEDDEYEDEEEQLEYEYDDEYEDEEYDEEEEEELPAASPRRKVVAVTACVFLVGFVAAVVFRKPAVPAGDDGAPSPTLPTAVASDGGAVPVPDAKPNEAPQTVRAVPRFSGRIDPVTPELKPLTRRPPRDTSGAAQPVVADPFAAASSPPPLATLYPAPAAQSSSAGDWTTMRTSVSKPSAPQVPEPDPHPFAEADVVADLAEEPDVPVTHVIRDGDTLVLLAERYLKDRNRYLEIFELNRDVLASPDLLPIGKKIELPPRQVSPLRPAAQMVPISRGRRTGAVDGAAQSYRVRRDDTLVDIARRVYGDESRYRDLYEANRDRLLSPHDLREGLELVLP